MHIVIKSSKYQQFRIIIWREMDSDSHIDEEDDIMTFQKRGEKHMQLSATAEKKVAEVTENSQITIQINGHLDPHNRSKSSIPIIKSESTQFEHFFVKNKYKDKRATAFEALRELLEKKGFKDIRKVSDKEENQVMVIRVIQKVQNALNVFLIEDEDTQAKIQITTGLLWIGMIAAVEARWQDGVYKLQKVIDLSENQPVGEARLSTDLEVYRIMFLKGSFRTKFGNEDQGIMIVTNEIKRLKKFSMSINCVVVMGPILPKYNKAVENCHLEKTYEQEYETTIQLLRSQINKINPNIQLFILPSTDDVISLYPLPQPAYNTEKRMENVKLLSNPSNIDIQGKRSHCKIDLINYDILKYIDTFKAGKATKELRQQNLQTYLMQPFYISNALPSDPFDQVNMGALYNAGKFGDLIVFSSQHSPPFVNQIKGRIVMNIGSLGVDYHYTGNNYMVIASIYEGDGPAAQRIKIQTVSCV